MVPRCPSGWIELLLDPYLVELARRSQVILDKAPADISKPGPCIGGVVDELDLLLALGFLALRPLRARELLS